MAEREVPVGRVVHFFPRPVVAGVEVQAPIRLGDRLRIRGHTTDLEFVVESMQVENRPVEAAGPGQTVGIRVPGRVREGDRVYRVEEGGEA